VSHTSFSLALSEDIHRKLTTRAARYTRSVSAEVNYLLEVALENVGQEDIELTVPVDLSVDHRTCLWLAPDIIRQVRTRSRIFRRFVRVEILVLLSWAFMQLSDQSARAQTQTDTPAALNA
jgi:plasmid stability protein